MKAKKAAKKSIRVTRTLRNRVELDLDAPEPRQADAHGKFKIEDWDFSPCPFNGDCPHGGHKGKEFCPHKIPKVKK